MNNVLKGNDIKNHTFYCFDDIIKVNDLDLDNILLDEKSYEIFEFMMLHAKLDTIQSISVLFLKN